MKKIKNKGRLVLPILVFVIAIAAIITNNAGARFIKRISDSSRVETSKMFVESDYLKDEVAGEAIEEYPVSDWSTDGITIRLYNYLYYTNTKKVSNTDVLYELSFDNASHDTTGWNVAVYDENNNQVTKSTDGKYTIPCLLYTGSMPKRTTYHDIVFTYSGPDPQPEKITVKITTGPYKKTMSATFCPNVSNSPKLMAQKKSTAQEYYEIGFVSNDYSGDVQVSWSGSAIVYPDTNNPNMRDWAAAATGSETFTAEEFTSYKMIFFRSDLSSETTFTVKKVGS